MSSPSDRSRTNSPVRLPPLHSDDSHSHSWSRMESYQLPSLRRMFPDIHFSQSVDFASTSLPTQSLGSKAPRCYAMDKNEFTSIPDEALDSLPEDHDINPRNRQSCSSFTTSSPIPNILLTSVTPTDSLGPPSCSFDILRFNRYSTSLEHIASSQTLWKSIPRVIETTSTGMASSLSQKLGLHIDTTNGRLEQSHQHHLPNPTDQYDSLWHGTSSSAREASTISRFGYVPSAQIRAAQAQADFEAEVLSFTLNTFRNRRHSMQDLGSLSIRDEPSRLSPSVTHSPTDSTSSHIPTARSPESSNDESTSPTTAKNKRRCDIERKHICPRCGRAFNRPSSLRMHGRTHTGFRPYVCPVEECAQTFTVSSNMRRHWRKHLISDGAGSTEEDLDP